METIKVRKRKERKERKFNLNFISSSSENAKIDHCIRKYLLQFSEYVFKPIDVGLKVTIRVPTLQVIYPHFLYNLYLLKIFFKLASRYG